jgi:excisionase family DNA binding protein
MDGKTPAEIPVNGKTERRLYDSLEARDLLGGISESMFRRLTGSGELPSVKIGRKVYIEPATIEEFIAARRVA